MQAKLKISGEKKGVRFSVLV